MRARASVSVCPRVSVHPCLRVLVRPCQCTFARVSVHAPEYFVCARAGEDERGRGEAGKLAFAWWEEGVLVSARTWSGRRPGLTF